MTLNATDELSLHRQYHLEAINRLVIASPKWCQEDRIRGTATIFNLVSQGFAIEARIEKLNRPNSQPEVDPCEQ